jgi:hypothetical protein
MNLLVNTYSQNSLTLRTPARPEEEQLTAGERAIRDVFGDRKGPVAAELAELKVDSRQCSVYRDVFLSCPIEQKRVFDQLNNPNPAGYTSFVRRADDILFDQIAEGKAARLLATAA